ncbi:hypothetical protein NP493_1297g00001 [Ridgeia piscesae]|uniref:Uncharacterized protein n=1 Tax=Ridgeia piscesae TaxID=27915 RepID=A0AAD9NED0_RIDPI|nr:hypothetical protein NP493_1297g00001 [Ridgeia piscesae]
MFHEWVNVSNVQRVSTGCKYGACAFFNGLKSAIEIPRFESTFSAYKSFSLSFWYRKTLENPHVLVSNGQCGDTPSLRVMGYFHGDIKATLHTTSGSHSGKVRVSTLEWHHLVVTWHHNKMRMYVDKQLVTQGSLSGPLYNSRCSLSIGAKPVNSSPIIGYYRGYIDQMCLYRSPLTPRDIEKLYNDPSIVKLP